MDGYFVYGGYYMKMLAFFLSGSELGSFVGGADLRFFEVSARLGGFGLQIFALEYESLHSERYGPLGYCPIRIKRRFSKNAILSCLRLAVLGSINCIRNKC